MEHLGSGSGGNSIFQSLSTPGEFVYCKETLEDNTGVCFYWLHLNMHLFLCFIYFLYLFMFFVYMVHEDKNSILDDHFNYVWFVLYLFYCVSTLFLWVSPVPPKSALPHGHCRHQSRQAEVLTLRKMFKAFLSSLFADQDSKKMSPHPTWSLMRRWKSAWDLDRGCNKRENAGRPQTFALHPHFLNEPHAKHIWYSQFSVHIKISMFANIRFSCWSAVSANHTNNKNGKSDLKKTQFSVFLTKNGKLNAIKSVFSPLFSRLISAAVTTCIEMVNIHGWLASYAI